MKILTVVSNLNKGGTQRAGQNFALGYKKIKSDSRILSLYGLGYRYKEVKEVLPVYAGIDDDTLKNISNWKPEIIHIHSHGPKKDDVKKLLDHLNSKQIYPKILEQNVFSSPTAWENSLDASFQLSKWCQWLYEKRNGKPSKSVILPYAVITKNFKPASSKSICEFRLKHGIPQDAFVIGRIGQAITTKWCKSICDVFEGVSKSNKNIYLLLIGCPPRIFKYFNNSLHNNKIISIDVLYGDDALSTAYSCMDVFYHAAEQGESFGHVLAESILCGTPVITLSTPWGDNSQIEVVNNTVGGFVVHKPRTAVKIIDQLIHKKLKYNPKRGINYIKNKYDYIKVCERAIKISKTPVVEEKILSSELWPILNRSYDKPRYFDLVLLKLNLRHFIRLTSGYNSIYEFILKIIRKLKF